MKQKLAFVESIHNEILDVSQDTFNVLKELTTTSDKEWTNLKNNLTTATLQMISWSLALKAVLNKEQIKMSEFVNFPELDFYFGYQVYPKSLALLRLKVGHLYKRVQRLNNDLLEYAK